MASAERRRLIREGELAPAPAAVAAPSTTVVRRGAIGPEAGSRTEAKVLPFGNIWVLDEPTLMGPVGTEVTLTDGAK
eukprot:6399005-Karenia_brevis.AAC.1